MRLISERQIEEQDIDKGSVDLFITACGYETRASFLAEKVKDKISPAAKFAFAFKDRQVHSMETNRELFNDLGFEVICSDGNSEAELVQHCMKFLTASDNKEIQILIDYSSMTRTWFAGLLNLIRDWDTDKKLRCIFSYTPSTFSEPAQNSAPNESVQPLLGFASLALPHQNTNLIIGLGYERDRAMGLFHYVEASDTYLFYSDPVLDNAFLNTVLRNNNDILRVTRPEKIFKYPLTNLESMNNLLCSLLSGLVGTNRVILAPLGPKPFALICLLAAMKFPGCDVWRVSSGEGAEPIDRVPTGDLLLYDTLWGH